MSFIFRPKSEFPDILGRLNRLIYVSLPDEKARSEIFRISLKNIALATDIDINALASATQGFTGADVTELCCRACKSAIRESIEKDMNRDEKPQTTLNNDDADDMPQIRSDHFAEALKFARRSLSDNDIRDYEIFIHSLMQRSSQTFGNINKRIIVDTYHDDDDLYN